MTAVLPAPPAAPVSGGPEAPSSPGGGMRAVAPAQPSAAPPASPTLITLASGLSAAAAAWMIGGLFRDFVAHLVALLGVVIGTLLFGLSHRLARATFLQWLTVPVGIVVGLILTAPDLGGTSLPNLVSQAVRGGGLLQPPVAFDPGWRVVLVTLLAILTMGSASVAVALQRPRLGVVLPLPLTIGAGIIQPASSQLSGTGVAVALTVAALSIAHGAELGRSGQVAAAFEARRLGRTTALAAGLFAAIAVLNNVGFLFPQPDRNRVIPPQPPPVSAPLSDRVLLSYRAAAPLPLRLGVIDVYDRVSNQWLLPEYDASRLQRLDPPIRLPGVTQHPPTLSIPVSMGSWEGHAIPTVAGAERLDGLGTAVSLDPRSETLTLTDRPVTAGLRYTLVASSPPTAAQLAAAADPPSTVHPFLAAPAPPNEVVVLLNGCRTAASRAHAGGDPFDILQCGRQKLYAAVVASGPGVPAPITPGRVGEMLRGGEASPYEIVAAETLLARWAGVPARIGYGYYASDRQPDGSYQVHPRDAATWLEAYFSGSGWVPILGQPARATASTSPADKNSVPSIATEHLQLILYIPYQRPDLVLLYELVQYYAVRVVPALLTLACLVAGYPWLLKAIRSRRRRRWARTAGPTERIVVAYCEMRDRARDLSAGDPDTTPLAFVHSIAPDAEHEELAWLVSRALWGDLRRDLRELDAVAAERWSRSVARRLETAQPMINRLLARISRSSLREPYSDQVPNLWWQLRPATWMRRRFRPSAGARRRRRRLAAVAVGSVLPLLVGCGSAAPAPRALPPHLLPAAAGPVHLEPQPTVAAGFHTAGSDALITGGLVDTVVADGVTYGDVQVELFRPDVVLDDINDESLSSHCADDPKDCPGHEVFLGLQHDFAGTFHRLYYAGQRVYQLTLSDQVVYLWFPPHTETMVILVLLQRFGAASSTALMHDLVDYQAHRAEDVVPAPSPTPGGRV